MVNGVWGEIARSKSLAKVQPEGRAFQPMSVSERSCLDVLSVMGLLPDWEVDDFTTAMIAAIAVSRPVERLRLLGLYPMWVYYTSALQDEGPERLLVIADLAEV